MFNKKIIPNYIVYVLTKQQTKYFSIYILKRTRQGQYYGSCGIRKINTITKN